MENDSPLTIDQLAASVAAALVGAVATGLNGRVREVPDVRTLRYYTTLGLLDRPRLEGRTAYYSRRHLLQLVAIKRLQARGLSLAQVQARLLNANDSELAALAELPPNFVPSTAPPRSLPAQSSPTPAAPNRPFWKAPPSAAADPTAAAPAAVSRTFAGIPLAGDVSLLLHSPRPLDEQDLAAIQAAAQPLLDLLRQRGLLL